MKYSRFDGFGKLKLVDGYQTVPLQTGALIWGGQLSGSNSLLVHLKFHSYSCISSP